MMVRWKSNLKIFLTLDIVELKSFLTLISAQQHPFSLLLKFKMNHKEVLYISSRKCENIWIKSLDIKVSLYSEAGVLHWEINPPHLWARLTPPLRRTNGLASLVSSILPPLPRADAASTTVFEHLARLSPEPCSGLCKQSYQTNTINNNLSWVGFYGSRYPGSPGSMEGEK